MGAVVENYPMLNDSILDNLIISNSFSLSYTKEGELKEIDYVNENNLEDVFYVDNAGGWNPYDCNFIYNGQLSLKNTNILFNEMPIVAQDSIIGVAVTVYSKLTKLNITKPIGEIVYNKSQNDQLINYSFEFPRSSLSQRVYIEISLYLKRSISEKIPFISISGANLGLLKKIELEIEGSGSIFPIKIIEDPDRPLWTMNINFDDIGDDFTVQTVCIKINKAHNDFKYLGSEDIDINNYYLWKEVLANFFVNILTYSKDDFDRIEINDFEDGTIGRFLYYIISNFELSKNDINNPIILSEKVRKVLDKIVK